MKKVVSTVKFQRYRKHVWGWGIGRVKGNKDAEIKCGLHSESYE